MAGAAHATSMYTSGGTTVVDNLGTGQTVGSLVTTSNYFNGATTPGGTYEDANWVYTYYTNSAATIEHSALILSDNANWVGLCNCEGVETTANQIDYVVGFSVPFSDLANAEITLDWAIYSPTSGVTATMWLNNNLITGSSLSSSSISNSLTQLIINSSDCSASGASCFQQGAGNSLKIEISWNHDNPISEAALDVQFVNADDGTPGAPSPEPGSAVLVLTGIAALVAGVRRHNKRT